jgi:hypothetical protein
MDNIVTTQVLDELISFVDIAKKDHKVELECKLLSGKIQTKDVADRILKSIQTIAVGVQSEEHRLTIAYADGTRVIVNNSQNIHKLCVNNSFKEIPLLVERKQKYFDSTIGKRDVIDVPEASARFTLRSEQPIRKDWEGNPSDPKGHIRMIHRRSFHTSSGLFRIDFSMVKTRPMNSKQSIRDMLKSTHSYELEIEFENKETSVENKDVAADLMRITNPPFYSPYPISRDISKSLR